MSQDEILTKLQSIFKDVLSDEEIEISATSVADDHEDWDSITFVEIISEIEDQFDIHLKTLEIEGFNTVGDMIKTIGIKLSGKV